MLMPALGESVLESTILKWLKQEGETVEADEPLLEVSTDKVDTDIMSEYSGVLKKQLCKTGAVIKIGAPLAQIEVTSDLKVENSKPVPATPISAGGQAQPDSLTNSKSNYYSPLVKKIAREKQISLEELKQIKGRGKHGRITKADILAYSENRQVNIQKLEPKPVSTSPSPPPKDQTAIMEMTNIRKVIAKRMTDAKNEAVHVTSFSQVDVTNLVEWRNRLKAKFLQETGLKLTYTPVFIQAVVKTLQDYELLNASLEDGKIIKKKFINIGMATALPDGNLVVPVIHNAAKYSLKGLIEQVNDLTKRARSNTLTLKDLENPTYTMSNIGMFDALMGTPIIIQPQVAIMAFGAIKKEVSVIETASGDSIGIRHKMYLSHSYDHRLIDGALGTMFAQKLGNYLENFSENL